MDESYEVQIQAAKERLNQSLADTAADVVVLADRFGKSIHAVAKDVTADQPELFNTIKARSSRLQKSRSEVVSGRSSTETPIEVRRARSDLKKPGVLDALLDDPDVETALMDGLARKMEKDAERIRDAEPAGIRTPSERRDHTIAVLLKSAVNGSLAWEKCASLVRGGSPDDLEPEDQAALEDAGSRTISAVAEVTTTVTKGAFV